MGLYLVLDLNFCTLILGFATVISSVFNFYWKRIYFKRVNIVFLHGVFAMTFQLNGSVSNR